MNRLANSVENRKAMDMGAAKANTMQVRAPWTYNADLTLCDRNLSGATGSFSTATTAALLI